uniref:ATP-dependent RNA helicase DDX42 n=1 Tax=Strigamia maritima TaxID=126957 RepID=T1IT60_STRMM
MFHKGGDGKPRGFGFGGFSLSNKKSDSNLGPSAFGGTSGVTKHGYTAMSTISQNAMAASFGMPCKRPKNEEEYFDEDEDEERNRANLEYIPAPGSPALEKANDESDNSDAHSEEDPLDAFMAGIEKEVERNSSKKQEKLNKGIRDDIEGEDDEESYYRYMEENPQAGLLLPEDSGDEIEYDEDGNPIAPVKSKYIDPLPPIDHSTIQYSDFEKNFYEEHEEIASLGDEEVEKLRQTLGVKVSGADPAKPVSSFAHFGFDDPLIKAIRKSEYTQPSPIQAQGVPVALSGRDIIGIAKTGSGKTAAFIWPMLVHIMDQKPLQPDDGPIGLILAPTRELSQQIYMEAKRFGKVYNIHVVCCYGGGSKWEQSKALQEGAEIVVATPGRMIDLIKMKATNLQRVTYLVLDEADRMFDMGFEPQVRSICDHVRLDRQTLLFSATFKKKVEKLARDILTDPVRVVQGDVGEANEDVTQVMLVLPLGGGKWSWLTANLVGYTASGSVLIFVTKKANCEELANNLKTQDLEVGLLHGDLDQIERNSVITAFKKKEFSILVATDVAARGLDIPHIKTVINYDIARDIDTHTHRVGRTGRAGEKGMAYTLVTEKDKEFAGHLVRNLEGANQPVPSNLMDLAMQSSWFRKSRFKGGKGKKMNLGGKGLGYRERPGLGSTNAGLGLGMSSSNNSHLNPVYMPEMTTSSSNSSALSTLTVPSVSSAKSGPQTDRISAMRAAFHAQYKQQFCAASGDSAMKTSTVEAATNSTKLPEQVFQAPEPPRSKQRKKSRWDSE